MLRVMPLLRKIDKVSEIADPIREERLNRALNGVDQQFVAQAIKRMPEDQVDLAWRSALNERLLQESGRHRAVRRRMSLLWRPMGLAAVAGAFALALLLPRENPSTSFQGKVQPIESTIVQVHSAAKSRYDLTGSALPVDATSQVANNSFDWQPSDLESL